MAPGNFEHIDVGPSLSRVEFESGTTHHLASQAIGDIVHATSAAQLAGLAIGAAGDVMIVAAGLPSWSSVINVSGSAVLITGADLTFDTAGGPAILNEAASATNPTLVPNNTDDDTGIGSLGGGALAIVSNGSEIIRMTGATVTFMGPDIVIQGANSIQSNPNFNLQLAPGGTGRLSIVDTNVVLGGTADHAGTKGNSIISIFDDVAPVGALANGASFYSAAGEMQVIDSGGVVTQLSPHDPLTGEWIFNSRHSVTGRVLRVDMERLVKFIDERFGTDFVHDYLAA